MFLNTIVSSRRKNVYYYDIAIGQVYHAFMVSYNKKYLIKYIEAQ